MKPFALTLCLLFAGAPVTRVEEAVRDLAIGDAAPDFALPGIDGKTHRLSDYKDGKVLIFFSCPTSVEGTSMARPAFRNSLLIGIANSDSRNT